MQVELSANDLWALRNIVRQELSATAGFISKKINENQATIWIEQEVKQLNSMMARLRNIESLHSSAVSQEKEVKSNG